MIIILAIIINYENRYYRREVLQENVEYNKNSKEISTNCINKKDIKIELINYDNSFSESNNEMNFDIKFSKENGKLHSVIFKTLIYDRNNVIWNGIPEKKYNFYRKGFFKEEYNKFDWLNTQDIMINAGPFEIVNKSPEDYSYLLYNIKIGLEEVYTEKDNVIINLIDLEYQNYGESMYNLISNTDIKFNIEMINN